MLREVSCMRSSKMIKRFFKVIAVSLVFVLVQSAAAFALEPVMYGHWVKHDLKEQADIIDTVYLGTSKVYSSLDPKVIDAELGSYSLNCGTASQTVKGSYYYLRQLMTQASIKQVIYDLSCYQFSEAKPEDQDTLAHRMIILDRITDPIVRAQYIAGCFDIDELVNVFFPAYFYKNNTYSIIPTVKMKLSDTYRNYGYYESAENAHYDERGFIVMDRVATEQELVDNLDLNDYSNTFDKESIEYFDKMVQLCKDNDIELFLISIPVTELLMKKTGNYDIYHNLFVSLAQKNNLKYYDFNFYKRRAAELKDTDYFENVHLNYGGAEKVSKWIGEVLSESKNGSDLSEDFYTSRTEVLQAIDASK